MKRWAGAAAFLGVVVAACGGGAGESAPEILYGEDICDHCRMVISEERHAAAARLDGREARFDDPGCLRAFLAETKETSVAAAAAWVHDETVSWRQVEEAWFVVDAGGRTPMGSGILAFGSVEAAAGEESAAGPARWDEIRDRPTDPGEGSKP